LERGFEVLGALRLIPGVDELVVTLLD